MPYVLEWSDKFGKSAIEDIAEKEEAAIAEDIVKDALQKKD